MLFLKLVTVTSCPVKIKKQQSLLSIRTRYGLPLKKVHVCFLLYIWDSRDFWTVFYFDKYSVQDPILSVLGDFAIVNFLRRNMSVRQGSETQKTKDGAGGTHTTKL